METRQVTQYRVYHLFLNTFGRAEERSLVAVSFEKEELINFYNSQLLEEGYKDGQTGMYISFKEGRFKFYNPLRGLEPITEDSCEINHWGQGVVVDWVDEELTKSPLFKNLLV